MNAQLYNDDNGPRRKGRVPRKVALKSGLIAPVRRRSSVDNPFKQLDSTSRSRKTRRVERKTSEIMPEGVRVGDSTTRGVNPTQPVTKGRVPRSMRKRRSEGGGPAKPVGGNGNTTNSLAASTFARQSTVGTLIDGLAKMGVWEHSSGTAAKQKKKKSGQPQAKRPQNSNQVSNGGVLAIAKKVAGLAATAGVPYASAVKTGLDLAPSIVREVTKLKSKIRSIVGSGDYESGNMGPRDVRHNSLTSGRIHPQDLFKLDRNDVVQMVKREFVCPIVATTPGTFTIMSADVAIANRTLFNTLGHMSAAFERYSFCGLVFEVQSEFLRMSTDGSQGTWGITCIENPYAPDYNTEMALYNANGCATGPMSSSLVYGVECAREMATTPWLYTDRDVTTDKAFHTMCRINLGYTAPAAITAGTVIGRLYVATHVAFAEMICPLYRTPTVLYSGESTTTGTPVGTQKSLKTMGGLSGSSLSNNVLTIVGGGYGDLVHMSCIWLGTTGITTAWTSAYVALSSGLARPTSSPVGAISNLTTPTMAPAAGVASTLRIQIEDYFVITNPFPHPTLTFSTSGTNLTLPGGTGGVSIALRIVQSGVSTTSTLYAPPPKLRRDDYIMPVAIAGDYLEQVGDEISEEEYHQVLAWRRRKE